MRELHLAEDLALPLDAVTHTFAILAKKGSGKTYSASVFAEELLQAGQRFIAIDPTGVWWGLKASADGKGPGFPVVVFGGEHADIPLLPDMGRALAELVASESICCILDLAELEREHQHRLVADFAEALYHGNREPLHLFVDEADEFAPQVPDRAQRRVLGALDRLVRRGRVRGLGCTLITQRAANLNKNVLSQAEVLLALQLTSAQDRRAIEAWVSAQADSEQQQDMMATLAGLGVGEAWVWSPSWLRVLRRVRIRQRLTFDSSATPKVGQAAMQPTILASPDLVALHGRLSALIGQGSFGETGETAAGGAGAGVEDPAQLREQIAILQRQLHDRPVRFERVAMPLLQPEQVEQLVAATAQLDRLGERLMAVAEQVRRALENAARGVGPARTTHDPMRQLNNQQVPHPNGVDESPDTRQRAARSAQTRTFDAHAPSTSRAGARTGESGTLTPATTSALALSAPQQRILDALMAFESCGLQAVARQNVAVFSRQSPKSSGFGNNLGRLHTLELITYPRGGQVALTDAGRQRATRRPPLTSRDELHQAWMIMLPNRQAGILRVLLARYPDAIAKDDLAVAAGQSSTSSGFGNNLGALRSLGLIDYPRPGQVVATDLLFPRWPEQPVAVSG